MVGRKMAVEILNKARKDGFAVPAFNIYNLETMQGVAEAAAEMNSPVFLAATPSTVKYMGSKNLLALYQNLLEKYSIPLVLHLDHFTDRGALKANLDKGFPSVMIDASGSPFAQNVEIVQEIVSLAVSREVAVEAELGHVGRNGEKGNEAFFTDPQEAREFVEKTGIDSLAVAIGTVHGFYRGEPSLDFARLEKIKEAVDIPLVLHGGSGLSDEDIKQTIDLGISKVNIATELKEAFTRGIRDFLKENPDNNDPRKYLKQGRERMKEAVVAKIKMCGSENKAQGIDVQ